MDGGMQQPTECRPTQWDIVMWNSAQEGDVDGGGCCRVISAIGLRGKEIRKTKFVVVLGGSQLKIKYKNEQNTCGHDGEWIQQDVWLANAESAGRVVFKHMNDLAVAS